MYTCSVHIENGTHKYTDNQQVSGCYDIKTQTHPDKWPMIIKQVIIIEISKIMSMVKKGQKQEGFYVQSTKHTCTSQIITLCAYTQYGYVFGHVCFCILWARGSVAHM